PDRGAARAAQSECRCQLSARKCSHDRAVETVAWFWVPSRSDGRALKYQKVSGCSPYTRPMPPSRSARRREREAPLQLQVPGETSPRESNRAMSASPLLLRQHVDQHPRAAESRGCRAQESGALCVRSCLKCTLATV